MVAMEDNILDTERHVKYWQRCLRSLLPTQYTSTDSSRMTLGFFILSALDILGVGADTFPEEETANIRIWILKCQHPSGGFCGSPNHRFPDVYYANSENGQQQMDPANLPATFFALLSLAFVGGFDGIERRKCLRWLKKLQRIDGSFGELVGQDGKVGGGSDMRYCLTAMAVRWMLNGGSGDEEDIDVEKLVGHVSAGQTYDGAISESSEHEAHAGYTYCGIAALSLANRLLDSPNKPSASSSGLTDVPATVRWLLSRQVGYPEDGMDEDEDKKDEPAVPPIKLAEVYTDHVTEAEAFVGFNGRCNKKADTCYAFWVAASLEMLGSEKLQLIDTPSIRRFLLQKTQHRIGGFGKCPGNPPDIYHSYLGLAALSVMKEPGLKHLDSALCISMSQKEKLLKLRESKNPVVQIRTYWKHGLPFSIREDDPDFSAKMDGNEEPPKDHDSMIDEVTAGMSKVSV